MAEGKKIVNVYVEWGDLFEKLTDDEAGRLIKHFFRYVNDQNPEAPDRLTDIAFEPIKKQLQRDLKKWEAVRVRNAENGKKGGRPPKSHQNPNNPVGLNGFSEKPKKAVEVEDEEEVEDEKKNKKLSLITDPNFLPIVESWLTYKKDRRESYKSNTSVEKFYKKLQKISDGDPIKAQQIIDDSIANNYAGIFPPKIENNGQYKQQYIDRDKQGAERKAAIMREAAEACAAASDMRDR